MPSDEQKPEATFERIMLDEIELLVIDLPKPTQAPVAFEVLSESEQAIAKAMIDGLSNRAIATQRGTSVKTVANQIRTIFTKLGVASRFELTARFAR